MGNIYTASFSDVAVTAAQDFFEIVAASTSCVKILSASLAQSSDAGDSAAEMLSVAIQRSTGTSGSGGSTLTPTPLALGAAAAEATVEANNTTEATTLTVLVADAFNVQAGWIYQPSPAECIEVSPSGRLVVTLLTTPADSLTMSGTITFEEIGGA